MNGEPSISNHDEYIHTYIQTHKEPYIPLHRVAAPDEVRADRDVEEDPSAARNILRWPRIPSLPSQVPYRPSHAFKWAMLIMHKHLRAMYVCGTYPGEHHGIRADNPGATGPRQDDFAQ